jgi:hypothetical protein
MATAATTEAVVADTHDESVGAKLYCLKEHAKDVASRHPVAGAAAVVAVVALAFFMWPVAAPAVAMMKAPGASGLLISRAAFIAHKKLYFSPLRTVGAAAAVKAVTRTHAPPAMQHTIPDLSFALVFVTTTIPSTIELCDK